MEGLRIADPNEYVKSCIDQCLEDNLGKEVSLVYKHIYLCMKFMSANKRHIAIDIRVVSTGRLRIYTSLRNATRFTVRQ